MYMLFFANRGFIHDVSFIDNLNDDVQITPMNSQGTQDTDDIPISSITDFVADITALFSTYASNNDGYELDTFTNTVQFGDCETKCVHQLTLTRVPHTSRTNLDGSTDMTTKDIAKIRICYFSCLHGEYTDNVHIDFSFRTESANFSSHYKDISTAEKFDKKSYNLMRYCFIALEK